MVQFFEPTLFVDKQKLVHIKRIGSISFSWLRFKEKAKIKFNSKITEKGTNFGSLIKHLSPNTILWKYLKGDELKKYYACFTNWISAWIFTSSLTNNPPVSVGAFQVNPKSLRLIFPFKLNPALTFP